MRLTPGSPRPVLPAILALTLAAFLPQLFSGATPFPQDLEPISIVGRESSYLYPSFQGLMSDNDTVRLGLDFQRMLRINHMLYIAARDHVFAVNLAVSSEQIIPRQGFVVGVESPSARIRLQNVLYHRVAAAENVLI